MAKSSCIEINFLLVEGSKSFYSDELLEKNGSVFILKDPILPLIVIESHLLCPCIRKLNKFH